MKAIDLAEVFNSVVGTEPLPSTEGPSFKVELSAPDGQSTGGGAQSVQHVRLAREDMTVVAGSIDSVARTAELRSFDYAGGLHAQRFRGAALPIDRAAYDAMLKKAQTFMTSQGLSVVVKDAAPMPVAARPGGGGMGKLVVGLIVFVAALVGGYFFMRR
jgi:hypothetical protein